MMNEPKGWLIIPFLLITINSVLQTANKVNPKILMK